MTDSEFQALWNASQTIDDVAEAAGRTVQGTSGKARYLREQGYRLKPLKTRLALARLGRGAEIRRTLEDALAQFDNHELSEDEFYEVLDVFSRSHVALHAAESLDRRMTEVLYRIAARTRAERKGVPQERRQPVEIAVVSTRAMAGAGSQ